MTKLVVHKFRVGDVDDPELYCSAPMLAWQKTDIGQWVMENAVEQPTYFIKPDIEYAGYNITIVADFKEEDAVLYSLRWR